MGGRESKTTETQSSDFTTYNANKQTMYETESLNRLLSENIPFKEWSMKAKALLKHINTKSAYRECCEAIIEYIQTAPFDRNESQHLLSDLFCNLKATYFVQGAFDTLKLSEVTSAQNKLHFLYIHATNMTQQQLKTALIYTYPDCVQHFADFIKNLVEEQIIVNNDIIHKLLIDQNQLEKAAKHYQRFFHGQINEEFCKEKCLEKYWQCLDAIIYYGNSQFAESFAKSLKMKGYQLNQRQKTELIQLSLINIQIYDLERVQIDPKSYKQLSTKQILKSILSTENPLIFNYLKKAIDIQSCKCSLQTILEDYILHYECSFQQMLQICEQRIVKSSEKIAYKFKQRLQMSKSQVSSHYHLIKTLLIEQFTTLSSQPILNALELAQKFNFFDCQIQLKQFLQLQQGNNNREDLISHACSHFKSLFANYYIKNQNRFLSLSQQRLQIKKSMTVISLIDYLMKHTYDRYLSIQTTYRLLTEHLISFSLLPDLSNIIRQCPNFLAIIDKDWFNSALVKEIRKLLSQRCFEDIQQWLKKMRKMLTKKQKTIQSMIRFGDRITQYGKKLPKSTFQKPLSSETILSILKQYHELIQIMDIHEAYNLIKQCNNEQPEQQTKPSDQYLNLKIRIAKLALDYGKLNVAIQLIESVMKHQPLWLPSQLVQMSKTTKAIECKFLNIIFFNCRDPQDLKYVLSVKKVSGKQSEQSKITFFNKYLFNNKAPDQVVFVNQLITNEITFKYHNAEMKSSDQLLTRKDYQLFLTLLGVDIKYAFYHAYQRQLDIYKLQIYFKQGLKKDIFDFLVYAKMLSRLLFAVLCSQKQQKYSFHQFYSLKIDPSTIQQTKANSGFYSLLMQIFKTCQFLNPLNSAFIQRYVSLEQKYLFVFDQEFRTKALLKLRDQSIPQKDISIYRDLCSAVNVDIIAYSVTLLCNLCNSEDQITNRCKIVLKNLVNLSQQIKDKLSILKQITQLIHCVRTLLMLLAELKKSDAKFNELISKEHIAILKSLKSVELNRQFYGLIPTQFLCQPIWYHPKNALLQNHAKILQRVISDKNMLILAKCMYFMYGMSVKIQTDVRDIFVKKIR